MSKKPTVKKASVKKASVKKASKEIPKMINELSEGISKIVDTLNHNTQDLSLSDEMKLHIKAQQKYIIDNPSLFNNGSASDSK